MGLLSPGWMVTEAQGSGDAVKSPRPSLEPEETRSRVEYEWNEAELRREGTNIRAWHMCTQSQFECDGA